MTENETNETIERLREELFRVTRERNALLHRLAVVRSAVSMLTVAIIDDPDGGGQLK